MRKRTTREELEKALRKSQRALRVEVAVVAVGIAILWGLHQFARLPFWAACLIGLFVMLGAVGDAINILFVRVEPDFAGSVVEGKLVPLPVAIASTLGEVKAHPWLVEAHSGYRWGFNIFVMVAGPLFVLCLPLLAIALWKVSSVERHSAISALKPYGPPLQVVRQIEDDVIAAGESARAGPLRVTPSWILALAPSLHIHALKDVIGAGHAKKVKKSGQQITTTHELTLWIRGAFVPESLDLSGPEVEAVIARLQAVCPAVVVSDTASFSRRWSQNRKACEQERDAQASAS